MLDETHAAKGVVVEATILPGGDFSLHLPSIATDGNGNFQLDLLPGCKYRIGASGKGVGTFASVVKELSITAGQQLDFGAMMLDGDDFVTSKQPAKEQASSQDSAAMKSQNSDRPMKQAGTTAPASSA